MNHLTEQPDNAAAANTTGLGYNRVAIALHWLLAIGLIYQLALGLWMEGIPKTPTGLRAEWFNWHKSVGLVLGLLIVLRGLWRLTHARPQLPQAMSRWQQRVAGTSHALLYACMLGMPLSGFLGSSLTPYPIKFFGTQLPRLWQANSDLKALLGCVHAGASYVFMTVLALHVAAAFWHALRRDGVFLRMWHASQAAPNPKA